LTETVDEMQEYITYSGGDIADFVMNQQQEVIELFETGSAEFYINEKCYIIKINIVEVKPNL
jgi:hypothetical protein